jgi:hypothetical protein
MSQKKSGYGGQAAKREGEIVEFSTDDANTVMQTYTTQSNNYAGEVKTPDNKFPLEKIKDQVSKMSSSSRPGN